MARVHGRTVQKDLHDPDNHDGVITDLQPDILECEVKWALGSKIARRNINNFRHADDTTFMAESEEELYRKDVNDPDNHNDVIIHLEPDILEHEVKWALGSITTNKAGGGDGIPAELFQILKDDALKVLHSIYQQVWKTQQWLQDWKRSVFIPLPKKDNAKECSNYRTIALMSHASKMMSKSFELSFNST